MNCFKSLEAKTLFKIKHWQNVLESYSIFLLHLIDDDQVRHLHGLLHPHHHRLEVGRRPQVGVNFINVLCTAFALVDPESVKNTVKSSVSFYVFGIYKLKPVRRTLMKLSPGRRRSVYRNNLVSDGNVWNWQRRWQRIKYLFSRRRYGFWTSSCGRIQLPDVVGDQVSISSSFSEQLLC